MADVHEKVQSIFQRIAGDRANVLRGEHYPAGRNSLITSALEEGGAGSDVYDIVKLDRIGFHLVNCNADAAFLVALLLYPEEFSAEEIRDGVESFMLDSSWHCAEALRLWKESPFNPLRNLQPEPESEQDRGDESDTAAP
ncbi:MAG: hypothetical protein HZB26_04105 [Candidatus Hydrogenedentes bacterium]|nr:hypothetical protein [Candidatus Hydrogenedentota bacterium]